VHALDIPEGLPTASGAQELRDWFGYWPSFHDAEVIKVELNRCNSSSLLLHTWEMTKDVDERGFFVLAKHVVVEILLTSVSGLDLQGFNHQNVIFELAFERLDKGFRVRLEDCYGISGTIDAKDIAFRLTPGKPS
jgi:hypothetical protein